MLRAYLRQSRRVLRIVWRLLFSCNYFPVTPKDHLIGKQHLLVAAMNSAVQGRSGIMSGFPSYLLVRASVVAAAGELA
jgi:hypothetical protein